MRLTQSLPFITKILLWLSKKVFWRVNKLERRLNGEDPNYEPVTFGAGEIKSDDPYEYDSHAVRGYYTEKQWDDYLVNFKLECVPNEDVPTCKHDPANGVNLYDTRDFFEKACYPVSPRISEKAGDLTSAGSDFKAAFWPLMFSLILAVIIS
jgi:hypothetical protein